MASLLFLAASSFLTANAAPTNQSNASINFLSALDLVIANQENPIHFNFLPNGYLVSQTKAGNQFAFFRLPDFAPALLDAAEATKQTFTIGELFTNSMFVAPTPEFTGPIDVVDGENDLPFCQSNGLVPEDKAAAVMGMLYPNAGNGSASYILGGAGHGINAHYNARMAYVHNFGFLGENRF